MRRRGGGVVCTSVSLGESYGACARPCALVSVAVGPERWLERRLFVHQGHSGCRTHCACCLQPCTALAAALLPRAGWPCSLQRPWRCARILSEALVLAFKLRAKESWHASGRPGVRVLAKHTQGSNPCDCFSSVHCD